MRRSARLAALTLPVLVLTLGVAWQASRSRTWQAFGPIVHRVATDERVVALTFDDGPTAVGVGAVLPALAEHGAKGTFYLIGREVEASPELARRIVDSGHEVGNHSWSHRRLLLVTPEAARLEVERTDAALEAVGASPPFTFRAPYCKKGLALPWVLRERGRVHVTFDVEPESDRTIAGSADAIAAHVRANVRPGSIVLLHPHYASNAPTREALPAILRDLRADGYRFVTVSELLALREP